MRRGEVGARQYDEPNCDSPTINRFGREENCTLRTHWLIGGGLSQRLSVGNGGFTRYEDRCKTDVTFPLRSALFPCFFAAVNVKDS